MYIWELYCCWYFDFISVFLSAMSDVPSKTIVNMMRRIGRIRTLVNNTFTQFGQIVQIHISRSPTGKAKSRQRTVIIVFVSSESSVLATAIFYCTSTQIEVQSVLISEMIGFSDTNWIPIHCFSMSSLIKWAQGS